MIRIKTLSLWLFIMATGLQLMAEPLITEVTVRQRTPWSRLVDIEYTIADFTSVMDIEVKAYNGIEELTLPPESLSGDLFGVVGMGVRKIVWDPTIGDYDNRLILPDFRIELSAKVAPLYMIIDLTKNPGEEGQIEYVFQDALMAGDWGTWEQNPVTNDGEVIGAPGSRTR